MLGLCKCFLIFSWLVIPLHLWFGWCRKTQNANAKRKMQMQNAKRKRKTQNAKRKKRMQYAKRKTQNGSKWAGPYAIRNTQYAMRVKVGW